MNIYIQIAFISFSHVALFSCSDSEFSGRSTAKKPVEKLQIKTEDAIPSTPPVVTSDDGDAGKYPRLQCVMFLSKNKHHGCGPSTVWTWNVWIKAEVPKLTNAYPSKEVAATADYSGNYGDNRIDGRKASDRNECTRFAATAEYKPMPLTQVLNGHTYQLFTDGVPGSEECPAYSQNQSPLIISFSSVQMAVLSPAKGPFFDIDASGVMARNSWPSNGSQHLFLVNDKNQDGKVGSGEELFGDSTTGPDGKRSVNGFLALKKHDANQDGAISASDGAIFNTLQLWGDENNNGISEATELHSLASMHVKSISHNYTDKAVRLDVFGTEAKETAVVELDNGKSVQIIDYWFVGGPRR